MSTFETQTTVNAPVESVWRVLADIGSISKWNLGVVESHVTTDEVEGVGAGRYCDLGGRNYLDESVVEWEPKRRLTMRIERSNLPFKRADIRFVLKQAASSTIVNVSPEYELKYGPLGRLLDLLFVRRTYRKGMEALLSGLKEHVENAEDPPVAEESV